MLATRKAVIEDGLWRLLPVINVDRVKDIPCDYPGAMGVPITFMFHHDPRFEIVDTVKPTTESGRGVYQRIIIRNLQPECPEVIDINLDFARKRGYEVNEFVPHGIVGGKLPKPQACKVLTEVAQGGKPLIRVVAIGKEAAGRA